ncbi:MAG: hypothetical protein CBC00_10370 [Verrucomicrobia bacterium TMED40]|nr:MAG: hypothetical protein CBC00_10370 [Verrucomicrobia bacterium TMED40]|tara:strand:- start:696 stop:944 length:249 start_codon:yes stop_codon:yes gene_type:complete
MHKISMQNKEVNKIIDNLRGRRQYEEKKATKLGYSSLYEYFEDKINKQKEAAENKIRELESIKAQEKIVKKKNIKENECSCC